MQSTRQSQDNKTKYFLCSGFKWNSLSKKKEKSFGLPGWDGQTVTTKCGTWESNRLREEAEISGRADQSPCDINQSDS